MTIQTCTRCSSLYHKTIKDICPKCVQQEEDDYKKIRMYLKRNKTVEMTVASQETGVTLELIHQFLQEGRISLDSSSVASYPCKECGASIQTGSLCTNCTNQLTEIQKTLQSMSESPLQEATATNPERKTSFHAKDY